MTSRLSTSLIDWLWRLTEAVVLGGFEGGDSQRWLWCARQGLTLRYDVGWFLWRV